MTSFPYSGSITTSKISESDIPDVIISNPLDKKGMLLSAVIILPTPYFAIKGIIRVLIDDTPVAITLLGQMTQFSSYVIPLSKKKIDRQGSISLKAWNVIDGSPISFSYTIIISDDATLNYASTPLLSNAFAGSLNSGTITDCGTTSKPLSSIPFGILRKFTSIKIQYISGGTGTYIAVYLAGNLVVKQTTNPNTLVEVASQGLIAAFGGDLTYSSDSAFDNGTFNYFISWDDSI